MVTLLDLQFFVNRSQYLGVAVILRWDRAETCFVVASEGSMTVLRSFV